MSGNVPEIDAIEKSQLVDRPAFRVGDSVNVHFRIREGQKERIQVFKGVVIRKNGGGAGATFTVRKVSGCLCPRTRRWRSAGSLGMSAPTSSCSGVTSDRGKKRSCVWTTPEAPFSKWPRVRCCWYPTRNKRPGAVFISHVHQRTPPADGLPARPQ